jgi:hypothetical protein
VPERWAFGPADPRIFGGMRPFISSSASDRLHQTRYRMGRDEEGPSQQARDGVFVHPGDD